MPSFSLAGEEDRGPGSWSGVGVGPPPAPIELGCRGQLGLGGWQLAPCAPAGDGGPAAASAPSALLDGSRNLRGCEHRGLKDPMQRKSRKNRFSPWRPRA